MRFSIEEIQKIKDLLSTDLKLTTEEKMKAIRFLLTGEWVTDENCPFYVNDSDYFAQDPTTKNLIHIGKGGFAKNIMQRTKNRESAIYYFRGEVITEDERQHRIRIGDNQCHVHELQKNKLHLDCWRFFRIGLCPLSALNTAHGLAKTTCDGVPQKAQNKFFPTVPQLIKGVWKAGIAKDHTKVVQEGEQINQIDF
jgi:hypothetical protein